MKGKAARIKKAQVLLTAFKRLSDTDAKQLISLLGDQAIETLSEVFYNSLYRPLHLSRGQKNKLQSKFTPHMTALKKISKPTTSLSYKRKFFSGQRGAGLVTVLAGALLPALFSLLKK